MTATRRVTLIAVSLPVVGRFRRLRPCLRPRFRSLWVGVLAAIAASAKSSLASLALLQFVLKNKVPCLRAKLSKLQENLVGMLALRGKIQATSNSSNGKNHACGQMLNLFSIL